MEAGRTLDALVAEKVMGWTLGEKRIVRPDGSSFDAPIHDDWYDPLWGQYSLPPYSTDIAAAWQVVEQFPKYGITIEKDWDWGWNCEIEEAGGPSYFGSGSTPPMAICLAALKAVGVDVDVENPSKSV